MKRFRYATSGRLQKITGRNRWCGPSAMSAALRIPTHECARILCEATGMKKIIGLYPSEMEAGLRLAGKRFRTKEYEFWMKDPLGRKSGGRPAQVLRKRGDAPTLSKWMKTAHPGLYLICGRYHFIVVYLFDGETRTGEWADSMNRRPLTLESAPMRMRVAGYIRMDD